MVYSQTRKQVALELYPLLLSEYVTLNTSYAFEANLFINLQLHKTVLTNKVEYKSPNPTPSPHPTPSPIPKERASVFIKLKKLYYLISKLSISNLMIKVFTQFSHHNVTKVQIYNFQTNIVL